MKKKYNVTGMMCAACQAHVEKAVCDLEGVENANVSLLGKSMVVDYDPSLVSDEKIISSVEKAGYGASIFVNESIAKIQEKRIKELKSKRNKLLLSIALLLILMVFSMGPMIFNYPSMEDEGYLWKMAIDIGLQFVLLIPIIILNFHHFVAGYKSLWARHPNMEALVALGSTVSIIYGIYQYIWVLVLLARGASHIEAMPYTMNIYIESAAMIPVFVSIGKYFEAKATTKTTSSISHLMALVPETCYKKEGDEWKEIQTESLEVDDLVLIKPGASLPSDGVIVEGRAYLDESSLTGESKIVEKGVGENVIGATVNKNSSFVYKVTRVGKDSTMGKIISLVEEASSSKAPIARLADKISLIFVPFVIGASLLTFVVWMLLFGLGAIEGGLNVSLSFQLAISVLVISCPCALGLATPVGIMVGTGAGAENGILIKKAEAFEALEKADIFLFDKTGTLTKGEMKIRDIRLLKGSEEEALSLACSLEGKSEHPLSKAFLDEAKAKKIAYQEDESFSYVSGKGITGNNAGIGNLALCIDNGVDVSKVKKDYDELLDTGATVLILFKNKEPIALFSIADDLKENAVFAVKKLQKAGKKVGILTGDNKKAGEYARSLLGADFVYSEILPDQKEEIIERLQKEGKKVVMVGDGVNDAPALTKADIGIAIGAGTEIAISSSDLVLVRSDPTDVASALILSKAVVKNIKENLLWAFLYNVLLIPLAAGALYGVPVAKDGFVGWLTGSQGRLVLTPMIASIAMSISSVTVVLNALRLRKFRRKDLSKEEK